MRSYAGSCLQVGNPCLHDSLVAFKTAYERRLWELGYSECSAVSLTMEVYSNLMQQLCQQIGSLPIGLPRLLLLRDCLGFGCLWSSAMRAMNAGVLTFDDVQDRRGQPLLPQLMQPQFPFPEGFQWQLAPNGTKPRQQRRAGVLPQTVLPAAEAYRDPLRLMHQLLQVRSGSLSLWLSHCSCMCCPHRH